MIILSILFFSILAAQKKSMDKNTIYKKLDALGMTLQGDLKYDIITRTIYATDASAYREVPLAVIWPKDEEDLKKILAFCRGERRQE